MLFVEIQCQKKLFGLETFVLIFFLGGGGGGGECLWVKKSEQFFSYSSVLVRVRRKNWMLIVSQIFVGGMSKQVSLRRKFLQNISKITMFRGMAFKKPVSFHKPQPLTRWLWPILRFTFFPPFFWGSFSVCLFFCFAMCCCCCCRRCCFLFGVSFFFLSLSLSFTHWFSPMLAAAWGLPWFDKLGHCGVRPGAHHAAHVIQMMTVRVPQAPTMREMAEWECLKCQPCQSIDSGNCLRENASSAIHVSLATRSSNHPFHSSSRSRSCQLAFF